MRRVMIDSQNKEGFRGRSWDPDKRTADAWHDQGGRIMVTSLCCLSLEVYYRYLRSISSTPRASPRTRRRAGLRRPCKCLQGNRNRLSTKRTVRRAAMAGGAEITARVTECPPPIVQHAGKESVQLDTRKLGSRAPYGGFMFPVLQLHTPTRFAMALVASVIASLAQMLAGGATARVFACGEDHGYGEIAIDYLQQQSARGSLPPSLAETMDLELAPAIASRSARHTTRRKQMHDWQRHKHISKNSSKSTQITRKWPGPWNRGATSRWTALCNRCRWRPALGTRPRRPIPDPRARSGRSCRPRFSEATARYTERYAALKSAAETEAAKHLAMPCNRRRNGARPRARLERPKPRGSNAGSNWPSSISISHRPIWIATPRKTARGGRQSIRRNLSIVPPKTSLACTPTCGTAELPTRWAPTSWRWTFTTRFLHLSGRPRARNGARTVVRPGAILPDAGRVAQGWSEGVSATSPCLDGGHPTWKKLDGFQGIKLEVAKATLRLAAELSGTRKTSAERTALTMLSEIGRKHGEHQQEALLLHREHVKSDPQDMTAVKTIDEAMALGESAAENQDWAGTIAACVRVGIDVDDQRPATSGRRSNPTGPRAHYQLSAANYAAGKYEECLTIAQTIVRDRPIAHLRRQPRRWQSRRRFCYTLRGRTSPRR